MSAVLALANPHRIKASHRRRWKGTTAHRVYAANNPYTAVDPDGRMANSPSSGCPNTSCEKKEPPPPPPPPCNEACMRMRGTSDGGQARGALISQIMNALFSTLAPSTANANKRSNHPTKLPDGAAARLSVTNGAALVVATGGQVVLPAAYGTWTGGGAAYDASQMAAYRVMMSPTGQKIAMGSCVAFSMCMQGRTGEDPGQFADDVARKAQIIEGSMMEAQRRWVPFLTK